MNKETRCHQSERIQSDDLSECLFVFGYSSKVFRDDQKAMEMDQGKHLIPWMGNENLKIDRYDVRGYLSDLSQYEVEAVQHIILSSEDKHIEEICDNERYRALYHNEEEQEMYKEEEMKRMKQSLNRVKEYSQVSYQYTDSSSMPSQSIPKPLGLDEPFSPSSLLEIPLNIALPPTNNMNQIIEKTANCVAKHGRQMEIIIKTRQAQNENFNFLNSQSDLNPYYEYILGLIKDGQYKLDRSEPNKDVGDVPTHQATTYSSYHIESAPAVPQFDYKSSDNCPYNMLVNKIHSVQNS